MPESRTVHGDDASQAMFEDLLAASEQACVEWRGRKVCWRVFGNTGPALVLIHGGHGNWLHWARNIRALAELRRVCVPDLPGYGDSDDAIVDGRIEAVVGPAIATLDQLIGAATPIDLAGFSFGGLVAAHIAANRPMTRRLALLGPGGHAGARRPRGKLQSWKEAAQSRDLVALDDVMRHNLAMHMLHRSAEDIDAMAVRIHTEACLRTRFRSKEISRAGGLIDLLAQRADPTLLIWGEHDVTADPNALASVLAERAPGCSMRMVEGAGHWVQYERASIVNKLLSNWLETTP
jgi:pimeloyl-ACP methyl ester carboxylesterase